MKCQNPRKGSWGPGGEPKEKRFLRRKPNGEGKEDKGERSRKPGQEGEPRMTHPTTLTPWRRERSIEGGELGKSGSPLEERKRRREKNETGRTRGRKREPITKTRRGGSETGVGGNPDGADSEGDTMCAKE